MGFLLGLTAILILITIIIMAIGFIWFLLIFIEELFEISFFDMIAESFEAIFSILKSRS